MEDNKYMEKALCKSSDDCFGQGTLDMKAHSYMEYIQSFRWERSSIIALPQDNQLVYPSNGTEGLVLICASGNFHIAEA